MDLMTKARVHMRVRPVVMLDGDALGFAAATLAGVAVVAADMLWLRLDLLTLAVRVGLTFVVTYAAVFLLTHIALRIVLREVAERQAAQRLAGGPAARTATEDEQSTGGTA